MYNSSNSAPFVNLYHLKQMHVDTLITTELVLPPIAEIFDEYRTSDENLFQCMPFDADPSRPTLICLTGLSGSGKDTLMVPLVAEGVLQHVQTATTRKRRFKFKPGLISIDYESQLESAQTTTEYNQLLEQFAHAGLIEELEPFNAYTWMRPKKATESFDEYVLALINEYQLVECNAHYNNVYGLPLASLNQACKQEGKPLVRNDINGVKHLRETLHEKFNILAIGIIPDDWEQVIQSICNREEHISQADLDCRLSQDANSIELYPQLVNFVIQNHRGKVGEKDGLEYSIELLKRIVTRLG